MKLGIVLWLPCLKGLLVLYEIVISIIEWRIDFCIDLPIPVRLLKEPDCLVLFILPLQMICIIHIPTSGTVCGRLCLSSSLHGASSVTFLSNRQL